MVSARGDPSDRVRGFARGADDYVIKPFVYEELVARMRAVLRRTARRQHPRLSVRDLEIDLASRVVRVGGAGVQLSAKEFDLLVALAEDPERVYRKEELLRDVWGFRSLGRTRTLGLPREPPAPQAEPERRGRLRRATSGAVGYRLVARRRTPSIASSTRAARRPPSIRGSRAVLTCAWP